MLTTSVALYSHDDRTITQYEALPRKCPCGTILNSANEGPYCNPCSRRHRIVQTEKDGRAIDDPSCRRQGTLLRVVRDGTLTALEKRAVDAFCAEALYPLETVAEPGPEKMARREMMLLCVLLRDCNAATRERIAELTGYAEKSVNVVIRNVRIRMLNDVELAARYSRMRESAKAIL